MLVYEYPTQESCLKIRIHFQFHRAGAKQILVLRVAFLVASPQQRDDDMTLRRLRLFKGIRSQWVGYHHVNNRKCSEHGRK